MSWLKLIQVIEILKHFAKQKWRHHAAGNKRQKQLGFLTFEPGIGHQIVKKRILFWSKTSKSRACSGVKIPKFGACSGFLEVKNRPWLVAHTHIPDIRKFPPPPGINRNQWPRSWMPDLEFFKKRGQEIKIWKRCTRRIRTQDPMITSPTLSPLDHQLQLPNHQKILAIYALTLLMYTVASPDPDPNLRGGVNYLTLTSAILL